MMEAHIVGCLQLHNIILLVSICHNGHNISLNYKLQLMVECSARRVVICF